MLLAPRLKAVHSSFGWKVALVGAVTYDQLGHLLSTGNTANGTVSYTYDKVGNQTSYTGPDGTVTSACDDSGLLQVWLTPDR